MTVYGRANKGKRSPILVSTCIFFLYFISIHAARITASSSAAGLASQIPVTPKKGRKGQKADDHKNKGSGESKYCRYYSVIQSSKHPTGKKY